MKIKCPFYVVFQVLDVFLIRICKIKPLDLLFLFLFLLLVFTSAVQISRTSFNIIWKKIFVTNFPFLASLLKSPHPFNGQNMLSLTVFKAFVDCSLILFLLIFFLCAFSFAVVPEFLNIMNCIKKVSKWN